MLTASIRSRARNRGDLAAGELSDLAAYAVGSLDRRHGQAIDLRPVLGVEFHPVDRQHVQVFLTALAIFARERNDVTLVGGIIERHREAGPSLLAVKEGDDLAREIVAGDLERFAVPGHQGIEIDAWPFVLGYRRRLGEAWCCEARDGDSGCESVTDRCAGFQGEQAPAGGYRGIDDSECPARAHRRNLHSRLYPLVNFRRSRKFQRSPKFRLFG